LAACKVTNPVRQRATYSTTKCPCHCLPKPIREPG
jgi:hypothetical protein